MSVGLMHTEASLENMLREAQDFNSPAHFVRPSVNRLPNSKSVLAKTRVPTGIVFQPMAPSPTPVPTVDFLQNGSVIRCKRCRTYVNPFVQWEASGRRWICNVCGFSTETPTPYFCALDAKGKRADRFERPELCCGSVEFLAPAEYMSRPPQAPCFMFLLEVTAAAVSSGVLEASVTAIRSWVSEHKFPGGDQTQMGIMTFDSTISFFNLNRALQQPQMTVISDLEDLFLPSADGSLVTIVENEAQILQMLDSFPRLYKPGKAPAESCMGSAIKAAKLAMKHIGGKLVICAASIPTLGDLQLKGAKDNPRLLNTDREVELLKGSVEGWTELAAELTKDQICVELFVGASTYVDLASLAPIAKFTGGDVHYYKGFTSQIHGEKLKKDLLHVLSRETGWEAVMRVRVSKGWKITSFYGHMHLRHPDLLVLPNCHSDQTFGVTLDMDDKESPDPVALIQIALLYTNSQRERRIRVHNYTLVTTANASDVNSSADPEVAASLLCYNAMDLALKSNLPQSRNAIMSTVTQILQSGGNCESLKPLPLMVLGMLKSPLFRATADVPADHRVAYWLRHESLPLTLQMAMFYPRMFALHALSNTEGVPDADGKIVLPPTLGLSQEHMTKDGLFLIDDGECMMLWVGAEGHPGMMHALFGVSSAEQINPDFAEQAIYNSPDPNAQRIRNVIVSVLPCPFLFPVANKGRSQPAVHAIVCYTAADVYGARIFCFADRRSKTRAADGLCRIPEKSGRATCTHCAGPGAARRTNVCAAAGSVPSLRVVVDLFIALTTQLIST